MNERFTLWLTDEERAILDAASKSLGMSRNKIVRIALRAGLGLDENWALIDAIRNVA